MTHSDRVLHLLKKKLIKLSYNKFQTLNLRNQAFQHVTFHTWRWHHKRNKRSHLWDTYLSHRG